MQEWSSGQFWGRVSKQGVIGIEVILKTGGLDEM